MVEWGMIGDDRVYLCCIIVDQHQICENLKSKIDPSTRRGAIRLADQRIFAHWFCENHNITRAREILQRAEARYGWPINMLFKSVMIFVMQLLDPVAPHVHIETFSTSLLLTPCNCVGIQYALRAESVLTSWSLHQ